jgi:hypothetical protein
MNSLNEIRAAIQERLDFLSELLDEYERLGAALEALGDSTPAPAPHRTRRPRRRSNVVTPEAPYGFKADGTPRKRPGRPPKDEAPPAPAEVAVLRVTTGGVPGVKDGAEPAYVTQEG